MTWRWTPWETAVYESGSPYIEWWQYIEPPGVVLDSEAPNFDANTTYLVKFAPSDKSADPKGVRSHIGQPADLWDVIGNISVPLPGFAINPDFDSGTDWQPDPAVLPCPPANSVIVGVIDSGIGLGNRRFRDAHGKSRILAAWQQNGNWCDKTEKQKYLPFGSELYKAEIDKLLRDHAPDHDPLGTFLEDDFNRAADLVKFDAVGGHRELAGRFAHGTHVLDQATGFPPGTDAADLLRRLQIIAVNLPNRSTVGLSGTFLDYFAIYAIKRIADLADLMWIEHHGSDNGQGAESAAQGHATPIGFPIVINMSFGKNAGARDGTDLIGGLLRKFNAQRAKNGFAPIHLVVPVGNDNLERGNASFHLAPGAEAELDLIVEPQDQSSNFVEIRPEPQQLGEDAVANDVRAPLEIAVAAPGQSLEPVSGSVGLPALRMKTLENLDDPERRSARIYSTLCFEQGRVRLDGEQETCAEGGGADPMPGPATWLRQTYTLCICQTLRHDMPERVAPPGRWRIRLRNASAKPFRVDLGVQTDQSTLPYAATGRRPRFDREDYLRFEPSGRARDSYGYPYDPDDGSFDTSPVLRRHGSINATASEQSILAIGGFRRADGRPAAYSATGNTAGPEGDFGRAEPVAAFPSDDGAAHPGVLASGASDGSVVAMSGTSFAAAAATRLVALHLAADGTPPDTSILEWLEGVGQANDTGPGKPPAVKIGAGRIDATALGAGTTAADLGLEDRVSRKAPTGEA